MTTPQSVDVAILGGGPAGSAAALMLKQRSPGTSVALIEASDYTQWRVGESLAPDAGRALRELGVWDSFSATQHLQSQGTAAAWDSPQVQQNEFIFHPEGRGWHLNRVHFDAWMATEAAQRGADLRLRTRYVGHQTLDKTTAITLQNDQDTYTLHAGLVLDAMGRMSPFARNMQVERKVYDRLSAVIGFVEAEALPSEIATYTLVEAVASGWWYSALLTDQRWVLAYMTDSDLLKKEGLPEADVFHKALARTQHTQTRVPPRELSEPLRVLSAASLLSQPVAGPGWIAVGDAASTFDPLSSQGIYKAIRSGMFAAYAAYDLQQGQPGGLTKYQRFIADEYQEYRATHKKFYNQVTRWPQSEFWSRRR